jgi:hypothetical protein
VLLIPAFVLLVVYGYLGRALVVFVVAGLTDALDGLIARRAGQKTSLGAWLDPMADKLLLVTTFVVLTLPDLGLTNRLPIWLTVLIITRDVLIVLTVAIVNRDLHRDRRGGDVLQLPRPPFAARRRLHLRVAGHHDRVGGPLRLALCPYPLRPGARARASAQWISGVAGGRSEAGGRRNHRRHVRHRPAG